jgi:TM2 domain-containing membrane protein YozV
VAKIKFDWSLVENRSELGRKLLAKRLFKKNNKSQLIAYICWALLGGMGLHRLYLGQWRQALFLVLFFIFVFVSPLWLVTLTEILSAQQYSTISSALMFMGFGVFFIEGFRLFFLVRNWNEELRQEIETQLVFI